MCTNVAECEFLTPAGDTEFVRDASFGYKNASLRAWVEEKTGGIISAGDVAPISIDTIRLGGAMAVRIS
jgi:hypothetical protein